MKEKEINEKMKELNEKAKELLGELSEIIDIKPKFKIYIETNKKGTGRTIEIKGNKASLMVGLADLATTLIEQSNLTEEDILFAINTGIKTAGEDEED